MNTYSMLLQLLDKDWSNSDDVITPDLPMSRLYNWMADRSWIAATLDNEIMPTFVTLGPLSSFGYEPYSCRDDTFEENSKVFISSGHEITIQVRATAQTE